VATKEGERKIQSRWARVENLAKEAARKSSAHREGRKRRGEAGKKKGSVPEKLDCSFTLVSPRGAGNPTGNSPRPCTGKN